MAPEAAVFSLYPGAGGHVPRSSQRYRTACRGDFCCVPPRRASTWRYRCRRKGAEAI